jgi:1-deoxy-D-xylulose-5-phosphate reductoisomerase
LKTISILGSTGSIGQSTLDVIRLHKDNFQIFALSCNSNINLLIKQASEFNPKFLVCNSEEDAKKLRLNLPKNITSEVLFSKDSNNFIASHKDVTHVVAAISGSAGLESTYNAAKNNKIILLANKESMVMAGPIIMDLINNRKSKIIPIDSEHNAIFQVLQGSTDKKKFLKKIVLTASGGPFLNKSLKELEIVSVEDALNHPNWRMGKKVTVDSATMMNKGLEVIEAHYLFDIDIKSIEVLIHPQSIIHSLVEFIDGSYLTQLGIPDMKIPISYALGFPSRINSGTSALDLVKKDLSFSYPDLLKFPSLSLTYDVLKKGHSYCVALNASNEVTVDAFLRNKINFVDIYKNNSEIINKVNKVDLNNLSEIIEYDFEIKELSKEILKKNS